MLHGFSGRLLSENFLEELVAASPAGSFELEAHRKASFWRQLSRELGPTSSLRAMMARGAEPLLAMLGFAATDIEWRDEALAATLHSGEHTVALLVKPWGEALDPVWREAVTEAIRRLTPWCLVFNGCCLRVVDRMRPFSRRYVEFELDRTLDDPRSFSALLAVLAAHPLHSLVDQSDRQAVSVCRSLREGVLAASTDVLGALVGAKRQPLDVAFDQALTIVYRIVFLMFAEARALVPVWHPWYRSSYSLEALRDAVEQTHGAVGLWDGLRAIARLAHAGCQAGDLRVTPFNGRLFASARTPLADRGHLDDEAARRALLALSTRPSADRAGRERIAYRDLGVEEIGAVYETLLDYKPALGAAAADSRGPRVELRRDAGTRKATGTFYTPQPLAEYIVRRTLGPLVREAPPDRILELRVLDPAMGSGAFLVAACRYLAAAYEAALVRAGSCHPSDIGEPERTAMRRSVAERCLYGVDLNPMAVQLARLSLWLTTLSGDRPLSFLDHRLQTGDSLLGGWLRHLGRKPGGRRRRAAVTDREPGLFDERYARDALCEVLPLRYSLEAGPNDTVEQVREKERVFSAMNGRSSKLRTWRRLLDLWCASWLAGDRVPAEAFAALSDALLAGAGAPVPRWVDDYLKVAEDVATGARLFHWELECPEVFFAADGTRKPDGGFDAVLGNPPWDVLRVDNPGGAVASKPRPVLRFTRDAGVYLAQSNGHANSYQLFAERAVSLARAGGRVGLVLPAGLATDHGSAALRRFLMTRCDIDSIVGFENRQGVFPIHRSIRFLLVTASAGRPTDIIACRFGVDDPAELESVDEEPAATLSWLPVRIGVPLLERISGDDLTIPWLPRQVDLAIAERAAALFSPLGSARGWSARFGRELNATEDREMFRPPGHGLPVVEGKQVEPFAVDLAASRWAIRPGDASARFRDGRHMRPRLAYRDVAGASNRVTLIAAMLPGACVSTHTLFCLKTPLPPVDQYLLCGLFNSFVLNYLVRLRVSTHVTAAMVERLPVPTRRQAPAAAREIAALARLLSRRDDPAAEARLQARVAALYQLTAGEFAHVLSTFPLISRRDRDLALAGFTSAAESG